jgi:hypothetical protein
MGATMMGKHLFLRTALTVLLPLILIWAFVEVLFREMGRSLRFAWLEVKSNLEAYHRQMRDL